MIAELYIYVISYFKRHRVHGVIKEDIKIDWKGWRILKTNCDLDGRRSSAFVKGSNWLSGCASGPTQSV